jgi:hypothetical protein
MLFQYLVGLFTLKHGTGLQFNVVVGDMVFDQASGTKRDVDVTVNTPDGVTYAFSGYEVKHWASKMDVSDVEALAIKLKDMPDVTHRAIVCSAGYTGPAIQKADYHGVDLYVIKEWTTPVEEQYPDLAPMKGAPREVFRGNQFHLCWPGPNHIFLHVDAPPFEISPDTTLFDSAGKKHPIFPDFAAFFQQVLVESSEILCKTEPMMDRVQPLIDELRSTGSPPVETPHWPFGHTLHPRDEVYVRLSDNQFRHVDAVTLQGELSWEYSPMIYLAMEKVPTGEKFASAMVGVSPVPGRMSAIILPTAGRTLSIRDIILSRDQLNAIRQLEIAPAEGNSSKE